MANTEYLNLTIYPEVAGVKQIDLRLSYLANAQIIDAFAKAMATKTAQLKKVAFSGSYDDLENRPDIPGTVPIATVEIAGIVKPDGTTITVDADGTLHGRNSYTKAEVDDLMAELSELLTSDDELTVLGTALDTLMGETNEYSGLGGSLVELDSMADELIA